MSWAQETLFLGLGAGVSFLGTPSPPPAPPQKKRITKKDWRVSLWLSLKSAPKRGTSKNNARPMRFREEEKNKDKKRRGKKGEHTTPKCASRFAKKKGAPCPPSRTSPAPSWSRNHGAPERTHTRAAQGNYRGPASHAFSDRWMGKGKHMSHLLKKIFVLKWST